MATSLMEIKQELVVYLRNSDVISISDRGVTTSQDTGTFSGALTHTLATNPTLVKNVRTVSVDGSEITFVTDYTVNYSTGVISFTSAQNGDYIIDYDQGSTDRIYPDYPQPHLKISSFPRIAVDIISANSNEFGIGADITESEYTVSVIAYDKDHSSVENMISSVKSGIMDNKKNFYYSSFITPTNVGPILVSEFGQNKLLQRNQDFQVRFSFDGY